MVPPRGPRVSALAAVAFDLDDGDLLAIDDNDEIETLDDAWLEPNDDTVIDTDPEATDVRIAAGVRYPPGLDDDEVRALIGQLTGELCRRHPRGRAVQHAVG